MANTKRITVRHEWRDLFDRYIIEQGKSALSKGRVYDPRVDESHRYIRAEVGTTRYNAYKVSIGPSPASATESWENAGFQCNCSTAQKKTFWGGQMKCQHMAALMLRWEQSHGPWISVETDEEMQERIRKEQEAERLRQEAERRKQIREEKSAKKINAAAYLKEKGFTSSERNYYDLFSAFRDFKTNQYFSELADEILAAAESQQEPFIRALESTVQFNEKGDQELEVSMSWKLPKMSGELGAVSEEGIKNADWREIAGDVGISMTYGSVERIVCSCGKTRYIDSPYFTYYNDNRKVLCHHSLCALLELANYIEKENPGDYTDKAAMDLFRALDDGTIEVEEMASAEPVVKNPVVTIKPKITYDGIVPKLSFLIGQGGKKQYVLRNMQEFSDALVQEGTYSLGKNEQIDFSEMGLAPEGEKWMQFISRKVADTKSVNARLASKSRWGYSTSLTVQAQEELKGAMLDRFYDMTEGTSCEYENKPGKIKGEMKIGYVPVRIRLVCDPIRRSDGSFAGVQVTGSVPSLMKGSQSHQQYCMSDTYLTRLSDEERRAMKPFENLTIGKNREFRFNVGEERLQEFIYRVLPNFQENPCIEVEDNCSDLVENILPPKPSFEFRLDYENEMLTLHEQVKYGDTVIELPSGRILSASEGEQSSVAGRSASEGRRPSGAEQSASEGKRPSRSSVSESGGERQPETSAQVSAGEIPPTHKIDGGLRKVSRDSLQEARVERAIRLFFDGTERGGRRYAAVLDEDGMYRILNEAVPTLSRYGEVLGTDAFNRFRIRPVPQVRVGVSIESGLMDLSVLAKDIDVQELLALMESYRKKKRYHRMKSGEFVALSSQEQTKSLAELTQIMEELDLTEKDLKAGHKQMPVYRALYVNRLLEEHDALAANRDRTFRQLIRNIRTVADSEYEPDGQMAEVLRPYQAYGYKWLRTLHEAGFGGILADEMGLGKTLQMIAVFQALKEEDCKAAENGGTAASTGSKSAAERGKTTKEKDGAAEGSNAASAIHRKHLVVCPASLVYNWQEEIARFAPDLKCCVVAGTAAVRKKILGSAESEAQTDVYITSYDLLKKDIVLYEKLHFDIAVLDEAQFIKNQKAAVTKSVKILNAEHRFALTGTPIENRLAELWSIFDYLMPGYLYNYETFAGRFETPIVKNKDEAMTERLKKMVGPFILRRRKEDVLKDLPEKLEEVRYARFEEEQQKLYDAQVVRMKKMISGGTGTGEDKIRIFAELTRIRQICCDPSLLFEDYKGASAKRDACIELIRSAIDGGHRMLVFSQFTSMLELLGKDLQKEGIEYYTITGATPKEQRVKLVHQFNEEEKVPVFLISLKAGGTGLNLVGADVVIHYDPWWNLAVQNQATDRAHRIGQTRQVSVFKLIGKDTIEEKIMALQEAKKDLADAILSGENQSLMSLSNEELLALLN